MKKTVNNLATKMDDVKNNMITEMNTLREDLDIKLNSITSHLAIAERIMEKTSTEVTEKLLQIENHVIANTARLDKYEEQQALLKASNDFLTKELDVLMLDKLHQNCYLSGLAENDLNMKGFVTFASTRLGIDVQEWHIKSVLKIKTKNNKQLIKIFFANFETRQLYYEGRKKLKPKEKIWFREDLTKPWQSLACHTRKVAGKGIIVKTWTTLGTVLAMKVGHDKPVRINTLEDLQKP